MLAIAANRALTCGALPAPIRSTAVLLLSKMPGGAPSQNPERLVRRIEQHLVGSAAEALIMYARLCDSLLWATCGLVRSPVSG